MRLVWEWDSKTPTSKEKKNAEEGKEKEDTPEKEEKVKKGRGDNHSREEMEEIKAGVDIEREDVSVWFVVVVVSVLPR